MNTKTEPQDAVELEKIRVLDDGLVAARDQIKKGLNDAVAAVTALFGEDAGMVVETKAHELVVAAHGEVALAGKLKISDDDQYTKAAEDLMRIKGINKGVEENRKTITTHIDSAKKKVQDVFNPAFTFLEQAEKVIKGAMLDYQDEKQRKANLLAAEAAEKARKEQEKLVARAEKAEEKGQTEKSEELFNQAAMVAPAPVMEAAPVAVKGIGTTTKYSAEVTDLMALVKAVAQGQAPLTLITADTKALNATASALKEGFNYPGCKLVKTTGISARSK